MPHQEYFLPRQKIAMLLSFTFVASCTETVDSVPDNMSLDRLERLAVRHPCIGDLSSWARYYRFDRVDGSVDSNIIDFNYREAGKHDFRRGRYVQPPRGEFQFEIDHRDYRTAQGKYNVREKSFVLNYCGSTNDPDFEVNLQTLPNAPDQ